MFKIIRLIGFPIFFAGAMIPYMGSNVAYFIGAFLALVGTFIVSRGIKGDMGGIGFAIIGFPIFFFSMSPTSYAWLYGIIDTPAVFFVRLSACFVGGIMAFMCFTDD